MKLHVRKKYTNKQKNTLINSAVELHRGMHGFPEVLLSMSIVIKSWWMQQMSRAHEWGRMATGSGGVGRVSAVCRQTDEGSQSQLPSARVTTSAIG